MVLSRGRLRRACLSILWLAWACAALPLSGQGLLPNTDPLSLQGDPAEQMVAGIDRAFSQALEASQGQRRRAWHRDLAGPSAYDRSILPNRDRLQRLLGIVDPPLSSLPSEIQTQHPTRRGEAESFTIESIRWPVLPGVSGEGLWLRPKRQISARVIAVPDADQTPEMLVGLAPGLAPERQFARRLAEHGCEVLVPVLINRQDTGSGNSALNRFTNQPHREWIYRQAYALGRHIIGFEVQKIQAAIDFLAASSPTNSGSASTNLPPRLGVAGYAEGGLLAFYAAALDPRIDAALVSGYFDAREHLWQEPIYRNIFGLLREFGDAEIATLIAPRALIVEHSPVPSIDGPPAPRPGHTGAAPGLLRSPDYESVESEYERARALLRAGAPRYFDRFKLISGAEGMSTGPGSDRALTALLNALGLRLDSVRQPGPPPADLLATFDPAERQTRQLLELQESCQKLALDSAQVRATRFWAQIDAQTPEAWAAASQPFRTQFIQEILGPAPASEATL